MSERYSGSVDKWSWAGATLPSQTRELTVSLVEEGQPDAEGLSSAALQIKAQQKHYVEDSGHVIATHNV